MIKFSPTTLALLTAGTVFGAAGGGYFVLTRGVTISPLPEVRTTLNLKTPKIGVKVPHAPKMAKTVPSVPITPSSKSAVFRDYSKVRAGMSKKQVRWWLGMPDRTVPDGMSGSREYWLYGFKEATATSSFGVQVVSGNSDLVLTFQGLTAVELKWNKPFSYTEFIDEK
ncbi:MAG: hypothetical protein HY399_02525 [Elusimicrobia bacterium]|nr:hypothetical protein [Elusimicrobiota bacterium]